MAKRNRDINLPAPYLKRVWLDAARVPDREAYPFCLPFLADDFELRFDRVCGGGDQRMMQYRLLKLYVSRSMFLP